MEEGCGEAETGQRPVALEGGHVVSPLLTPPQSCSLCLPACLGPPPTGLSALSVQTSQMSGLEATGPEAWLQTLAETAPWLPTCCWAASRTWLGGRRCFMTNVCKLLVSP